MLLLTISGIYSQGRLITEVERDSIVFKINRGNEAIEQNKILEIRIIERDSVIKVQTVNAGIQKNNLALKGQKIINLNTIITNQKVIISNEKKRGRRKGLFGFLKGVGIGAIGMLLLTL